MHGQRGQKINAMPGRLGGWAEPLPPGGGATVAGHAPPGLRHLPFPSLRGGRASFRSPEPKEPRWGLGGSMPRPLGLGAYQVAEWAVLQGLGAYQITAGGSLIPAPPPEGWEPIRSQQGRSYTGWEPMRLQRGRVAPGPAPRELGAYQVTQRRASHGPAPRGLGSYQITVQGVWPCPRDGWEPIR